MTMAETLYFEHTKTKKRFKIVEWDEDTGRVKIKGPTSTFTEVFNKDLFKKMGYTLRQVDEAADEGDDDDAE